MVTVKTNDSIISLKIDKIDSVERDRIKIGEITIPVSDTYRKSFMERINAPGR